MSATVEIRLFAAARAAVGAPTVTAPAGRLQEILTGLEATYPDFSRVRPQCSLLVDGLAVPRDSDVDVPAGSQLDVLPPFAGG